MAARAASPGPLLNRGAVGLLGGELAVWAKI
jgi:hypothetical protein